MLTMMMFNSDWEEAKNLVEQSRDIVAHQSDEQLVVSCLHRVNDVREEIKKGALMDSAMIDLLPPGAIDLCKSIRREYQESHFLLIADGSISPMRYLNPDIRAMSLLLRPFTSEVSREVLTSFFGAMERGRSQREEDRKFVIENREGMISIPYSKIYYFEVRGRKIYARLKEKEYSKYDTLDNMIKSLPDDFIRCHRSFIVNKQYIYKVKLSENCILLEGNISVPLSRSYKPELKAYMQAL